jgi:hypothetical protein
VGTRNLDPEQRRRVEMMVEQISRPGFTHLQHIGAVDQMGRDTASRAFDRALIAVIDAQQHAAVPTDEELRRHGGLPPDTMRRLMRLADLSGLPLAQLAHAIDEGVVSAPSRLIVEARTERTTGPDKFGALHLQPPPSLAERRAGRSVGTRRPASNTVGGIASALVLAECDAEIVPVAVIPIAQGHWDPANWPSPDRLEVERQLRLRADLVGPFVTSPSDVIEAILAGFSGLQGRARWAETLDSTPITGGRLRLGYPLAGAGPGGGSQERYLGCTLRGLRELRTSPMVPFFEVPRAQPDVGAIASATCERCPWAFIFEGKAIGLGALEERLLKGGGPWVSAPADLVRASGGSGQRIFTLSIQARCGDVAERVTMVAMLDRAGRQELFVTTLDPSRKEGVAKIAHLAISEIERRRPDSLVELTIAALLQDCYLQTHRRRRYPDRRSFAGISQAGYAVRRFARVA